ncbi:MAG: tetraacyldisaccharide 4'-kinase [Gammaproteobacteria bacterium]
MRFRTGTRLGSLCASLIRAARAIGARLAAWLEQQWYDPNSPIRILAPLSWLYVSVASFRRCMYQLGLLKTAGPACPLVVVGNLSVGGTGKTPLVIWLAGFLREQGWKPGIISRGYGGKAASWPQRVGPDSDPLLVGDEAVVIARHSGCPIVVGPDRVRAARLLHDAAGCDIIVSDDGLQHYALRRDIEIAVVDSTRLFGNGYCLPAGPLREGTSRLQEVDLVVYNGAPGPSGFAMTLVGDEAVNNCRPDRKVALSDFFGVRCHALAGIGNPRRFFDHLKARGLEFDERIFRDHHRFSPEDLYFGDESPVFMTEKDAVKCVGMSRANHWTVPVKAQLESGFGNRLLQLLATKSYEQKTA